MAKRRTVKKKTKKKAAKKSTKRAGRVTATRTAKKTTKKKTAAPRTKKATRTAAKKVVRKVAKPRTPSPAPKPAPQPAAPPPAPVTPPFTSPSVVRTTEPGESFDNGDDSEPIPRTYLTEKQLREFRQLLLDKRKELVGDVQNLTNEALNRQRDGGGDHSSMPIHMADLGTDNWEQEFTLGLAESERALLRELDDALDRINNRTYGICLGTHQPITLARLQVQPWTRYSIEYARKRDEGRRR